MRVRTFAFYLSEFLGGGFVYGLIEILFRGYTHESMFLLGGVCFIAVGALRRVLRDAPMAEKMVLSGGVITALELFCGILVNVVLGLGVWDYSRMPLNLWGQVCLSYSAAWCLLALPAMGLDLVFYQHLFGKFPKRSFQAA